MSVIEQPAVTGLAAHRVTQIIVARPARRHRIMRWTFVLIVVLPTIAAALYLWLRAADQYSSKASFSIRSEEYRNPLEALGAFTQVGASSSSDAQILYDFIKSQPLVEQIDRAVDLRKIYGRVPEDVVFALPPESSIEDVMRYWDRMAQISIDSSTGMLSVEVRAFDPEDAARVAGEIIRLSGVLVNGLSQIAREDATKFAREEVTTTQARLKDMRLKLHNFRIENDTIDPKTIVSSQMGVVAALQNQLADALVERGTILGFASLDDQRVRNLDGRISAIRDQIETERRLLANNDQGLVPLVQMMGTYEELLVDLEFSQNAYTAALAAAEQASVEARRKSRYLAIHIPPTTAHDSLYPQRGLLTILVFTCLLAFWGAGVLVYYNVRDR
ncbi:MAG: hypothetical protein ABI459_06415, partial [Deltaproteobacteria bacterium]